MSSMSRPFILALAGALLAGGSLVGAGRVHAATVTCETSADCDDGDACTSDECEYGECVHETLGCDDGLECTTDTCDAGLGCTFTPIPTPGGGTECEADAPGTPVAGSRLRVDDVGDPRGKRNAVTLTDAAILLAGLDPTVTGATATIGQPGGAATVIDLPARGWTRSGSGRRTGFKYKSRSEGVLAARLIDGRSIRLSARAAGIHGLGGMPQGELGVVVQIGSARFCARFGGTIRVDDGAHFVAGRAPAPPACPVFGGNG